MPNRNISDVDLLVFNEITGPSTGDLSTLDLGFTRHDLGVNIYAGVLPGNYTSGTAFISIYHSDEPTTGFELIPERDILTSTDAYPNYLVADAALLANQSLPFVQLKAFKRYLKINHNISATLTLSIAISSRPSSTPADPAGAIIPTA